MTAPNAQHRHSASGVQLSARKWLPLVIALTVLGIVFSAVLLRTSEPASASGAGSIVLGGNHSCAVIFSGAMKCWGYNFSGQIGDNSTTSRTSPVSVCQDATCAASLSGVASAGAGSLHSCAVTNAGGVKCWGNSDFGERGDGTVGDGNQLTADNIAMAPVIVCATGSSPPCGSNPLTSMAPSIDGGSTQTCAVTTGGGVKCWGLNSVGQLGDGTSTQRTVPVVVCASGSGSGCSGGSALSGVSAVSVGSTHACALTTAGGVKCWGGNSFGQLGDGTTGLSQTHPVTVCATGASAPCGTSVLSSAIAVSVGGNHSCALISGGGVKCWGNNEHGELGDGTQGDGNLGTTDNISTTPVDVCATGASAPCGSSLLTGATGIAAGLRHTCAPISGGGAKCWGNNEFGQVGDGTFGDLDINTPDDVRPVPIDVCTNGACSTLLSGVADMATGDFHTCSRTIGGSVKCWGRNLNGQLGNGTTSLSALPVNVTGLSTDKPPTETPTDTPTPTHTPTPTNTPTPTATPTNTSTPKPSPTPKATPTTNPTANGTLKIDADCSTAGIQTTKYVMLGATFNVCVNAAFPSPGSASGYQARVVWTTSVVQLNPLTAGVNDVWGDLSPLLCGPPSPNGADTSQNANPVLDGYLKLTAVDDLNNNATCVYNGPVAQLEFVCQSHAPAKIDLTLAGDSGGSIFYSGVTPVKAALAQAVIICLEPTYDSDNDGCANLQELGTNQMIGGRRDPYNHSDYFNPSHDKKNRVDDILLVVNQYFDDDSDGSPGLPPYVAGYNPETDRTLLGPNAWNLGAPNGLQRVDDILYQVNQYFHDCS